MPVFKVENRIEVPLSKGQLALHIRQEFWERRRRLREIAGCYIFAVPCKFGVDGLQPIYVGKATHSFDECFTNDKIAKINDYLREYPTAALYLFLVVHPTSQRRNPKAIGELELALIKMAVSVNPNLKNKKGTRPESWGIAGIIRGGRGKRSDGAKELRLLLGIDTKHGVSGPEIPATPASVQVAVVPAATGAAINSVEPTRAPEGARGSP